jgi:hypothetical protein
MNDRLSRRFGLALIVLVLLGAVSAPEVAQGCNDKCKINLQTSCWICVFTVQNVECNALTCDVCNTNLCTGTIIAGSKWTAPACTPAKVQLAQLSDDAAGTKVQVVRPKART